MSGWYDSDVPVEYKDLKTSLYQESSKLSGSEIGTRGDIYKSNFLHHIFYKDVHTLTKGNTLEIKSFCYRFGDDYSLLYFNAYDAQLSLLGL